VLHGLITSVGPMVRILIPLSINPLRAMEGMMGWVSKAVTPAKKIRSASAMRCQGASRNARKLFCSSLHARVMVPVWFSSRVSK